TRASPNKATTSVSAAGRAHSGIHCSPRWAFSAPVEANPAAWDRTANGALARLCALGSRHRVARALNKSEPSIIRTKSQGLIRLSPTGPVVLLAPPAAPG